MKEKYFHECKEYPGTATVVIDNCTECGITNTACMEYTAEHNAGELFTVTVCAECLKESLSQVEAHNKTRTGN